MEGANKEMPMLLPGRQMDRVWWDRDSPGLHPGNVLYHISTELAEVVTDVIVPRGLLSVHLTPEVTAFETALDGMRISSCDALKCIFTVLPAPLSSKTQSKTNYQ